MGSLTNYWEIEILEHALRVASFGGSPSTLALALFTADPTGEGTFSFASEVSGNGYARAQNAPGAARWTKSGSRAVDNDNDITFPISTGAWGTVAYYALCNSSTATTQATPIFWGQIAGGGVPIGSGQTFYVQANGLDITIPSGFYSNYLASALIDHFFLGIPFSMPTSTYATLSDANPGDAGTGMNEPDAMGDGSYARVTSSWVYSGSGTTYENNGIVAFAPATISWGDITHLAVMNAVTGGSMLFYGALSSAVTVDVGYSLQFNDGGLTLTTD